MRCKQMTNGIEMYKGRDEVLSNFHMSGTEASMKLIKAKCVEVYVLPNHASDSASFMDLKSVQLEEHLQGRQHVCRHFSLARQLAT